MKKNPTSRREFLALSGTVLAGTLLSPGISWAKKRQKTIGIQLYSIRDNMQANPKKSLERVAGIGYKELETASYADGKIYTMRPTEFKGHVDGLGLQVRSAHVMGPEFDAAGNQYHTDFWKKAADDHAVLGATYLVKPAMPVPETKAALAAWAKYYEAIGAICAERGLKFGFHNHDWEFRQVEDVRMLDFLIQETNPELVTFELDVYWCQKAGVSPVEFMDKYPGRFELLHIKDEKEIGESGEMDFESIFQAARKAGGMRHYFVEVERYNYEPMESIERSFHYLAKADYV